MLLKPKRYLFKAAWRATALKFWVEAKDEAHAIRKAEQEVLHMIGGIWCLDIQLLRTENVTCFNDTRTTRPQ